MRVSKKPDIPTYNAHKPAVLLHEAQPKNDHDTVSRSRQKAYVCFGLPWMPHYTREGSFVAPGGVVLEEATLLKARAIEIPRMLWTRAYNYRKK